MNWPEYFCEITQTVARKSPCLRRKVGSLIVKDKRILATGYNGVPSGFQHCTSCSRKKSGTQLDRCKAIHAEANAIIQCALYGVSCDGADMWVSVTPCNDCLKKIIQARIRRVFVLDYYQLDDEGERMRGELLEEANAKNGFQLALVDPEKPWTWPSWI